MALRVVIHINHAVHQETHAAAMKAGLERHGIAVTCAPYNRPTPCDVAVVWGWRQSSVIARARASGAHVLVMERGFVGDRFSWTSIGWDGLNGRATWPEPADDGERFDAHFGDLLRPWRENGAYALVCGQVPGDAALYGQDLRAWACRITADVQTQGWSVKYRPHPFSVRQGHAAWRPADTELCRAPTLIDALGNVGFCVTYNSNSGVEAVMAGVPTLAADEGSMAYPVAAHTLADGLFMPDRREWCARLAWCQWTLSEIAAGDPWPHLRELI